MFSMFSHLLKFLEQILSSFCGRNTERFYKAGHYIPHPLSQRCLQIVFACYCLTFGALTTALILFASTDGSNDTDVAELEGARWKVYHALAAMVMLMSTGFLLATCVMLLECCASATALHLQSGMEPNESQTAYESLHVESGAVKGLDSSNEKIINGGCHSARSLLRAHEQVAKFENNYAYDLDDLSECEWVDEGSEVPNDPPVRHWV